MFFRHVVAAPSYHGCCSNNGAHISRQGLAVNRRTPIPEKELESRRRLAAFRAAVSPAPTGQKNRESIFQESAETRPWTAMCPSRFSSFDVSPSFPDSFSPGRSFQWSNSVFFSTRSLRIPSVGSRKSARMVRTVTEHRDPERGDGPHGRIFGQTTPFGRVSHKRYPRPLWSRESDGNNVAA